jgi:hypothetical protein
MVDVTAVLPVSEAAGNGRRTRNGVYLKAHPWTGYVIVSDKTSILPRQREKRIPSMLGTGFEWSTSLEGYLYPGR